MSAWNELLKWALTAAATEAQKQGLKALGDASLKMNQTIKEHAPDLAPSLQPLINQAVQGAVAGILTKLH